MKKKLQYKVFVDRSKIAYCSCNINKEEGRAKKYAVTHFQPRYLYKMSRSTRSKLLHIDKCMQPTRSQN